MRVAGEEFLVGAATCTCSYLVRVQRDQYLLLLVERRLLSQQEKTWQPFGAEVFESVLIHAGTCTFLPRLTELEARRYPSHNTLACLCQGLEHR